MGETLPPHLRGLQQTVVPARAQRGVVVEHEWRRDVIGAQAAHVVARAGLQEVGQFIELVTKNETSVSKELLFYNCVHVLDTTVPSTSRTRVLAVPREWTTSGRSVPEFFRPNWEARWLTFPAKCASPKQHDS